ncbi:Sensory/regulatory protein RpfC [Pigmentiphaga humi]|uniref:Virulence sensor protein BvgS n=1 Tax=Pigmentiphaga humi TaxID=2478468 RepID=A0A3P4B4F6_9BURK|nr:response regulator [Pigmentiphaga humi]VCU70811.1 Sensory/regulatory protein RpfC [Pigmentiphaga humi]
MALPRNLNSLQTYLLAGVVALVVFATDMVLPIGYAIWVFYFGAVISCLLSRDRYAPYVIAAACCGLIIIGYGTSPNTPDMATMAIFNRAITGFCLLGLAGIVSAYIQSSTSLARNAWVQDGQVRLSKAVQGEQSESEYAALVLRTVADYLRAQAGVMYSLDGGRLRRVAGWALPDTAGVPAEIPVGEGAIGQAVLERKALVLDGVPVAHLQVGSALGAADPARLIAAPVTAEGKVVGAIELAFTDSHGGSDDAQEMLQTAAEAIGSGLRSAQYRMRLEELLAETRRQSEELQVQQEELRVSNEELEERSRALMDSQSRLETQQAELEQTNSQLNSYTDSLEKQKQNLIMAQRALAENARALERANQYKSEFLANMSHELRTPLNSSLILAKLLSENKDGNLSDDQVRYAQTIHSSNTDLLVLINDILDLSKVEAGHIEIQAEPVAMASLLEALQRAFEPVAAQKHLAFVIERADDAPQLLVTDNQRLQQILKNLLANAFKFTERGRVTLKVSPAGDNAVRFDVTDTGIGIPSAQQDVIFEAFRQADGTTSRKYGGSGLGLSISREFAHLLGGEITVSSQEGTGSTFSLTVALHAPSQPAEGGKPAVPHTATPPTRGSAAAPALAAEPPAIASAPAATPAAAPPAPVGRVADDRNARHRPERLILVIEDDLAFARILYDLAHELDFDCIIAASAGEGMGLARTAQPCGILLDVGLPDDSGLSVLERLKRDPATRHLPVHVISATDYTETALQLGAIGYTLKPSAREHLENAIHSLENRLKQRMRRILIVEDDAELRGNIQLLLDSPDLEQTGAGTMADALEQLRSTSFDCVIMDLALPDGSGYDLLEKMASGGPYAFPPVIVYTGRSLTPDEEQRLRRYSKSIIIKGAKSPERLLDEVTLFLHSVESELPAEKQRMLKEARKRDSAFEGRRILLAEDDIRNIFALSQVIEPLGAQLEIARNGREALDLLAREGSAIDLVLMDIMMPEMDGLTAIREIRAQNRHARLPIIALTAKAMPADRQRCLDAGASDYISKPLDVDKLLSLCRVWLPQ